MDDEVPNQSLAEHNDFVFKIYDKEKYNKEQNEKRKVGIW